MSQYIEYFSWAPGSVLLGMNVQSLKTKVSALKGFILQLRKYYSKSSMPGIIRKRLRKSNMLKRLQKFSCIIIAGERSIKQRQSFGRVSLKFVRKKGAPQKIRNEKPNINKGKTSVFKFAFKIILFWFCLYFILGVFDSKP